MSSRTMSTEEHEQLHRAAELLRPIARAAALGRKNGLGLLIFGVLGVLLSLPGLDAADFAIGAILTTTGLVEVRASRRLARADPAAPGLLARNELLLMAGILVYCMLQLTVLRASGDELAELLGDTSALGIDVAALTDSVNAIIYSTFIAVTLLYQGGLVRYFLRRRPMIDAYLRECPEWARRVVVEVRD
ncbi:MAG: hypothetical protein E2O39_01295 [Planctomycetota bacterium]|nr:MAG: hypothetical protein E2O39_01295 [Planctomycetota bacterium]